MDNVLKNVNDCLSLTSDLKGICVFDERATVLLDKLEQKLVKTLIYISGNFPEKHYFLNQENTEKWENMVDGFGKTLCHDPEPFNMRTELGKLKESLDYLYNKA